MELENSEVAGNRLIDLENKQINDYSSPEKESVAFPMATGIVQYTLDGKKTEFFAGNSLEDYLRMDATLALGIRHEFDGLGIMGIRLLASTIPTDVWEDPLDTTQNRTSTERKSAGVGLKWENIMESKFDFDLRARNIEFDNDKNGQSLVSAGLAGTLVPGQTEAQYITNAQQKDLEREGSMASAELTYTWKINDSHILMPAVKFTNSERDGDARDFTQSEIILSHWYNSDDWTIATTVSAAASSYDDDNPVFDNKQDTDFYSAGMNIVYKKPFGWEDWGINAAAFVANGDSDIDFYDTNLFIVTLGMGYKF